MIKNIKLFVNKNDKSLKLAKLAKEKFIHNGFNLSDENFDLGISIGGDGSFLRMVKNTNFDNRPYYVGINSGTLGFVQEVKPNQIDDLIKEIQTDKFKTDLIGIQETSIISDANQDEFYSLNEIVVRDNDLKLIKVAIKIDDDLLENYTGDGLLIATSTGSTAHNLSLGGSIVYNNFSTLQVTPIAPINSKSFRTLPNSIIIPDCKIIQLTPNTDNKDFIITTDGENRIYKNVSEINTTIQDQKIKMLRFSNYNFPQKINEKLLSD